MGLFVYNIIHLLKMGCSSQCKLIIYGNVISFVILNPIQNVYLLCFVIYDLFQWHSSLYLPGQYSVSIWCSCGYSLQTEFLHRLYHFYSNRVSV